VEKPKIKMRSDVCWVLLLNPKVGIKRGSSKAQQSIVHIKIMTSLKEKTDLTHLRKPKACEQNIPDSSHRNMKID